MFPNYNNVFSTKFEFYEIVISCNLKKTLLYDTSTTKSILYGIVYFVLLGPIQKNEDKNIKFYLLSYNTQYV